jgi:hypothetical protein
MPLQRRRDRLDGRWPEQLEVVARHRRRRHFGGESAPRPELAPPVGGAGRSGLDQQDPARVGPRGVAGVGADVGPVNREQRPQPVAVEVRRQRSGLGGGRQQPAQRAVCATTPSGPAPGGRLVKLNRVLQYLPTQVLDYLR